MFYVIFKNFILMHYNITFQVIGTFAAPKKYKNENHVIKGQYMYMLYCIVR